MAVKLTDYGLMVRNILAIRCQRKWLDVYFSGKEPDFTPPLRMETTPFRKAVWEILLTIPFGQTMTYGEIADMIAGRTGLEKMSAQAVGGAVGHNAISLIIPCHRVVGSNGSLTGYAGGIEKKVKLLTMEKAGKRSDKNRVLDNLGYCGRIAFDSRLKGRYSR